MGLPLSTMLSHALVAFTIETDHVFEVRMPHCTTESRKRGEPIAGPWLISMPFWANSLKHVEAGGMTVEALSDRALIADRYLQGSNPGLVRWGYLRLVPDSASPKRLGPGWTVLPTPHGVRAQDTWASAVDEVDGRWGARWPDVPALRSALETLVAASDRDLPDHLPVNGGHEGRVTLPRRPPHLASHLDVGTLLAKALLLFTLQVEASSPAALVHSANLLRVLARGPLQQRDLPPAIGVAKETVGVMTGQLQREGLVTISADKEVTITEAGRQAVDQAAASVADVEAAWSTDIRARLAPLVGDGTIAGSAFSEAIQPPEGTWRHRRPQPSTLPHHPVISHRGGYPDGS